MASYCYETHIFPDPLLPFLFHREFVITKEKRIFNWHENIELLFCTEGSGYVICGERMLAFGKGDIVVVNATLPHCICSQGQVRYRCLIVDDSFLRQNGIGQLCFQERICSQELGRLFEKVTQAYGGSRFPALEIRCAVLNLLRRLCMAHTTEEAAAQSIPQSVQKAIHHIRTNYTEPLTLEQIAQQAGISKFHLCRQFKLYTGSSILQTVNQLRCTQAKLLMEGGATVSEAALSSGFDNLSYFSRTFKKHMGTLPSQLTIQAPK